MAVTEQLYTGDGNTTLFTFPFEYINTTDVKVSINSVDTTAYTLANATTVSMNTAPLVGESIRIYRDTNNEELTATFYAGSTIRATNLNDNFLQTLFVSQESENSAAAANVTAANAVTTANNAVTTANTAETKSDSAVATSNAANATAATAETNSINAVNTANTANTNSTAAVNTANAASTTAGNAVTTANTAVTTANGAVTTANGAATDAATAIATANSAVTTANSAVTTANTANTTANTASTNANTAVTTANNAVTTANTANTTANTASTTATAADNKADQAIAAVAAAILYDLVANVAAIPANPANNDAVEVGDSTGIQNFTPLAGLPAGFTGSTGLSVRIVYDDPNSTWNYIQYFANDMESRYLKFSGGTMTGDIDMDTNAITNLVDPTAAQDAATRNYVDTEIAAISQDSITEGNTSAEVVDTGSDGHFKVIVEGQQRFHIANTGRVGIGTSLPQNDLHIKNDSTVPQIRLENANSKAGVITGQDGNITLQADVGNTHASSQIAFFIDQTQRATIVDDGRITTVTDPTGAQDVATKSYVDSNSGAKAGGAVYETAQTISADYTMTLGFNGISVAPLTISPGITVTIPAGATLAIV